MIRVKMYPSAESMSNTPEGGIKRVVEAYERHAVNDVEYVDDRAEFYDVLAVHAAASLDVPHGKPLALHLHGLYWTADYSAARHEHSDNASLVQLLRRAEVVTVPSEFVARPLRRDMGMRPLVIPHAVDHADWALGTLDDGYILWAKNRTSDVCSPESVTHLARALPRASFLTTFADEKGARLPNVKTVGTQSHVEMQSLVKRCGIYLSTTQETFGIGALEAMAAGKPILGFRQGALPEMVEHRVQGWLAEAGDYDGLAEGAAYIRENYQEMARAASARAGDYTWKHACELVYHAYDMAFNANRWRHDYSVVIPVYNKEGTVALAIESVLAQTVLPRQIVVVNNNSTDGSIQAVHDCMARNFLAANTTITLIHEGQQGVAHARNAGIARCATRYVACLDADDAIAPTWGEKCVEAMRANPDAGLAYTGITVHRDGGIARSDWPHTYEFDRFALRQNQVPTCAMFRHDLWERSGGYRQKYAPLGAGSEDANFWMRLGEMGYRGVFVNEPLFHYYVGGATYAAGYSETPWADMPWVKDGQHPFASCATPTNKVSHPVRSYDVPDVSIIIPVGPNHTRLVEDAIDSVVLQGFRNWEIVVVIDTDDKDAATKLAERLGESFPYVEKVWTGRQAGAGAARNLGVETARGHLLLFLDADDVLRPDTLGKMVDAWNKNPDHIIYTDYTVPELLTPEQEETVRRANRLLGKAVSGECMVRYNAFDYDCERAQRQPNQEGGNFYLWCNVTSLVPKSWHDRIGGFDEEMEAWEDWDYWIRLARLGLCFYHLREPLLIYRMHTGTRRRFANPGETGEDGRQRHDFLLSYMREKYNRGETMGCRSCGGRKSTPVSYAQPAAMARSMNQGVTNVSADDLVSVQLVDGNSAKHPISVRGTSYGYRRSGDKFKMLREHAALDGRIVVVQNDAKAQAVVKPSKPAPPAPTPAPALAEAPEPVDEPSMDESMPSAESHSASPLLDIWGVGEERVKILEKMDIHTAEQFVAAGEKAISDALNVAGIVLKRMMASARKL